MRERLLDLVFLAGVLFKGVDGVVELAGGGMLLFVRPGQLLSAALVVTAGERGEDPHDVLAHLLLHEVGRLDAGGLRFLAAYLVVHGVVKLAIVVALLLGSRRVYPWAIAALVAFLVYQVYELAVSPSVGLVALTLFDAAITALTWREWRHGRTLRETTRATVDWLRHRPSAAG